VLLAIRFFVVEIFARYFQHRYLFGVNCHFKCRLESVFSPHFCGNFCSVFPTSLFVWCELSLQMSAGKCVFPPFLH
jgi:hypothetical protein